MPFDANGNYIWTGTGNRTNTGSPGVGVNPTWAATIGNAASNGNVVANSILQGIPLATFDTTEYNNALSRLKSAEADAMFSSYNGSSSSSGNNGGGSGFSGDSGVGIADVTFKGIETLGNLGLGIWKGIEQAKNNKTMRQAMVKQMQVAQEQINASQQARKERASELARLNKVRSNTNKQFNTSAQVSRSY